ncbi:MAG: family 16 glycoside hydrolase [Verrucomicrobiota bacterium]
MMMSKQVFFFLLIPAFALGEILLQDDFNREESDDALEEVGGGWQTNSAKRAQGVKQADLREGALHIVMAKEADHGVSVVHDVDFRNATISVRFRLDSLKDDLGINIADMKEKSVHAGHICVANVRPTKLTLSDLKTGNMKQEHRKARQAGTASDDLKELLKTKTVTFPVDVSLGDWHDLLIRIEGETMTVSINGKEAGTFSSEGIGHATKSRIRVAVKREAWIDNVVVTALPAS